MSLTDDQRAVRDLARQVLAGTCSKESLDHIEQTGGFFSEAAWRALSEAGLAGLAVPGRDGGAGLDLVQQCLVLQQVGRYVAPVPLLESAVMAAPTLAHFGDDTAKRDWLPGLIDGSVIATCALQDCDSRAPLRPTAVVEKTGDTFRLHGAKTAVPWLAQAAVLLVSARGPDGPGLWMADVAAAGLSEQAQRATDGQPLSMLTLDAVEVRRVGGEEALAHLVARGALGRCAVAWGIAKMALALTAEHCRSRQQFGAPIGSFQAVSQRAADMYIDTATIELSVLDASWRLQQAPMDKGIAPAVASALHAARYWATEAGHRVVAAAQHLHGGTGFDRDYPVHRCFLRARRLELGLGTARESLAALGGQIACG